MIKCIYFDMDGVLIQSEKYWRIAEKHVFNSFFNIDIIENDLFQTTGLKTSEVVKMHCKKYNITFNTLEIENEIEKKVVQQIFESGKHIEGLYQIIDFVKYQKINPYLVTSSSHFIIENVLKYLKIEDFFIQKFSAYDCRFGKPNPEVYLNAINYSGIEKKYSIAIEDSKNGILAAKKAGLDVWCIPEYQNLKDSFFIENTSFCFHNHLDLLEMLKNKCL